MPRPLLLLFLLLPAAVSGGAASGAASPLLCAGALAGGAAAGFLSGAALSLLLFVITRRRRYPSGALRAAIEAGSLSWAERRRIAGGAAAALDGAAEGSAGLVAADVYGLGLVLAAMATGRTLCDERFRREGMVKWLRKKVGEGRVGEAVDERLRTEGCGEMAGMMVKLALLCTADQPRQRPSSKEVCSMIAQIPEGRESSQFSVFS